MIYRKTSIFFFLISVFICSFLQAGFINGTLVKTLQGFVPIQELQINDKVYAYDTQTNECISRSILAISTHDVPSIIWIKANDKHIFADSKQPFYIASEKSWCNAIDLQPGMVLQSYHGQNILVKKVTELHFCTKVYDLTLNTPHNFCVTSDGIVVHNFGFIIPVAYFSAQGITLASGIGYSLLCAVGAWACYKVLAETTGATIDPNLSLSNANFLDLQEPTFNQTWNQNTHTQQYYLTSSHDSSYSHANNNLYQPQKTSADFGTSNFEKYHGVHDTQSFPIPKLPTTNACLAPGKNNYLPEISTCPPPEKEDELPILGCGQPPLPGPIITGHCFPPLPESDIAKCPGIVGAWDSEMAETSCNWSKNPPMPGLLEINPESSDDENINTDNHDDPDTDNKPPAEDKAQAQDSEITPEKKRKNNKPPKESDRPWDLPEHDPAIDIEKIDFSLTPHLTEEEIELIKECIKRFLDVEGLLANDCPIWRILKHEAQKKGALFELEYIIELSNQGHKIIKMGYEVKVIDGLVEIDIETDTELIECKSGGWETKRENKIDQLQKKLIRAKKLSEKIQKTFIVVSGEPIPTMWENWLNQNDIEYKEWQP